jgi:hypothetical protein
MGITQIEDNFERYFAFVVERDTIRLKRLLGDPAPWTTDHTLQTYRFTNINRENDKVSIHYQKTVRDKYKYDARVIPATVLYRWFNRISTCDALFNEPDLLSNKSAFERCIETQDIDILDRVILDLPTPHVTGAFIIQGKSGYTKGQGVLMYFQEWTRVHATDKSWIKEWDKWQTHPPLLAEMYRWLQSDGLGSFMTGQLVADLKYLPYLSHAPDWHTWATPGPGSKRGLNAVNGRSMDASWTNKEWLWALLELRDKTNPRLESLDIDPLHAQDLQNTLCEFSKYEKVRLGLGRPRQVYHA